MDGSPPAVSATLGDSAEGRAPRIGRAADSRNGPHRIGRRFRVLPQAGFATSPDPTHLSSGTILVRAPSASPRRGAGRGIPPRLRISKTLRGGSTAGNEPPERETRSRVARPDQFGSKYRRVESSSWYSLESRNESKSRSISIHSFEPNPCSRAVRRCPRAASLSPIRAQTHAKL